MQKEPLFAGRGEIDQITKVRSLRADEAYLVSDKAVDLQPTRTAE